MKLIDWFKQLAPLNKLAALASLAGIIGTTFALITFFSNPLPSPSSTQNNNVTGTQNIINGGSGNATISIDQSTNKQIIAGRTGSITTGVHGNSISYVTESGDINIGLTIEQYEQKLEKETASLRNDLEKEIASNRNDLEKDKKILTLEKELLEKELSEKENQLKNLDISYEKQIKFLESTITELRTFSGEVDEKNLADAETALQQGDTSKADNLYKQIEEKEKGSIERAAKAAFERGKIAEGNIKYQDAYLHYERAVGLSPSNPEYLSYAGAMAGIVAKHQKEIEWKEMALAIYIKQKGGDSSEVAVLRNNLGEAWRQLGEYKKAIDYYEQALDSDLKTYGDQHPDVAIDWNNLGEAWRQLGEYKKAIDYYEQALASGIKTYGDQHPNVATSWNNLEGAWSSLGQYKKAIDYYEQALASGIKTYGEGHPDVAIDWNNLGSVWYSLGQYKKAIDYYEQAFIVFESKLGENHHYTKSVRAKLALLKK